MTIPLNDDTKKTFLNILQELRKSLPNSADDDVAAIMYLYDRVTESDQGRTLTAYVEAAHADPVAVRITGPLAAAVIANCNPSSTSSMVVGFSTSTTRTWANCCPGNAETGPRPWPPRSTLRPRWSVVSKPNFRKTRGMTMIRRLTVSIPSVWAVLAIAATSNAIQGYLMGKSLSDWFLIAGTYFAAACGLTAFAWLRSRYQHQN